MEMMKMPEEATPEDIGKIVESCRRRRHSRLQYVLGRVLG